MVHFYEFIDIYECIDLICRLIVATIAGGIVGLERKRRNKEAGMRTHGMVALGSALFAIVSKYGFLDIVISDIGGASVDVSRVAANIVTGVCFLGAGMIFVKSRSITGLTTAAGIWSVSGIGLAIGCGMYVIGIASSLIIIVIQFVLHKALYKLEGPSSREMTVVIEDGEANLPIFDECLKKLDPDVYYMMIEKCKDGSMMIKIKIRVRPHHSNDNIYTFINEHQYVRSISC